MLLQELCERRGINLPAPDRKGVITFDHRLLVEKPGLAEEDSDNSFMGLDDYVPYFNEGGVLLIPRKPRDMTDDQLQRVRWKYPRRLDVRLEEMDRRHRKARREFKEDVKQASACEALLRAAGFSPRLDSHYLNRLTLEFKAEEAALLVETVGPVKQSYKDTGGPVENGRVEIVTHFTCERFPILNLMTRAVVTVGEGGAVGPDCKVVKNVSEYHSLVCER